MMALVAIQSTHSALHDLFRFLYIRIVGKPPYVGKKDCRPHFCAL